MSHLIGSQTPRIDVTPLYFTTAGDDAIDLAAVAGLILDEWQEYVLRGSLGERVNGAWKATDVGVIVARQNGKGSILEARELAGLFLFGEKTILHTAHLFGTAVEHQQRLEHLIRNSELVEYMLGYKGDPQATMSGIKTGNSGMSFETQNGNRLLFKARSRGSMRGYTANLVVFDEAYDLPRSVVSAMLPTLASKSMHSSTQVWYTSSAGFPDSDVLADLRTRALNPDGEEHLAFYEWSAPDDADPTDKNMWALANPALGLRISEEFIESERRSMDDESFKRERLGIWAKLGGTSAIPAQFWANTRDTSSGPGNTLAFGVDVTPLRDVSTISVAALRPDGNVHPKQKRFLTGLTHREYTQACGAFYDAIASSSIRHIGQEELDEAVNACRRSKGNGELWYWTRDDRTQDISPLVACTIAYEALMNKEKKKGGTSWAIL